MTDQVVTKDSWLAQPVGGSAQYGNGTGGLLHVGPAPAAVSGDPDYKGRSVFEVDLTTVLAGLTSITSASFSAVVGGNSCIGSRGGTIRIRLEEMTVDFNLKTASGDCGLASGTGASVWGISNNINSADSSFHTSGSHSTGDTLTWDITALIARKLSEGATLLRFRLVAVTSDNSALDEANQARRISFYSVRNGTSGNRPKISVTGSSGSVAKSATDSAAFSDASPASVTNTGSGTVNVSEAFTFTETSFAQQAPEWSTEVDAAATNGVGQLIIPSPNESTLALLPTVSIQDLVAQVKFKIDQVPIGDLVLFNLVARVIDHLNFYKLASVLNPNGQLTIRLVKMVAGVETTLQTFTDINLLQTDTFYWLKLQCQGVSPTTLSGKIWPEEIQEPGWELTINDSQSVLQAAGAVGLGGETKTAVSNTPLTFQFDEFTGVAP